MFFMRNLVFLTLAAVALARAQAPECKLVPGWQQDGPARSYVADNLFEYMDGNAEGYVIYGFVRMQGVTCKQGGASILIDISEMANPDSAYGIFTANRDLAKPLESIGMGGQIVPRRAMFAKGNYYVELAANPDQDHTLALRAFATALEARLSGRTTLPETLGWFPAEKLVSARLIPESVLGLRLLKSGYVAQYDSGKAFVVAEETAEAAQATMAKLRARFGATEPAQVADDAFQAKDRYLGGLCIFRKGRYVAGWANLPEAAQAVARATPLASRIP